ncbi:MAG: succinyl-diaminopimelate desuccinylase [Candidatus Parabeggiatoa sp. nov. 3]|nr:MAG: succinyl-diaminopimelate desuccinylase [Gammaproteobacteria bacterium]RKZ69677.1 MAG: succinyl-diaminopimelate desuccinylase [Gammaproteobacteria bacterium]RKZ88092.1 MAG: succinyl-diaminopimelate desuccinylase [Gammaproteobacteria bacterium]
MSTSLELAQKLISCPSITPNDAGCQPLIAKRLQSLDFNIENLRFGEVDNLWARRGQTAPLFVFAGHTDVVPTGPKEQWQFPPFTPTQHQGFLYGRGAADMKSSIAAMITACERFIAAHPQHNGSIAFLITSDEEGPGVDGTVKVINTLQARNEQIDWCLVGEPSSTKRLGDVVKNGRRGSLNGVLTIHGVQGHAAYPHLAENPIHRFAPVLKTLCEIEWDQGNDFFPPTCFQITNLKAGTGADNVIPGDLELLFNFRYSSELTHTQLQEQVTTLLDKHSLNYTLTWRHSGPPYLTTPGTLVKATEQAILEICGYETSLSTSGGTSDGRFIAPTGAEVIEIGPLNSTIHKINECVSIDDIETLSALYQRIMEKLLL